MTTYCQEDFISQAIDSILMQEVNFDYEIVIGEDASTDRTRAIVLEFQNKYPDKIRVLLRDPVDAERDRAAGVGGKGGFVNGLGACEGVYVALLDGDDYWTDVHKLQKQVDFLDSRPDYALCFHNARIVREDRTPGPETFCRPEQKLTSNLEDLLAGNFMFTGSTMFRRGLFASFPDWFYTSKVGDWPLHIINSQHGKIGYLNETMAVYRVHHGSWWSSGASVPQLIEGIGMLDHIDSYLGYKYHRRIKTTQSEAYAELAEKAYQDGDLTNAKNYLAKCLKLGIANYRLPTVQQLGRLFKLQSPAIYNLIRSWRDFVYPHRS